jgi:hypothetical protein
MHRCINFKMPARTCMYQVGEEQPITIRTGAGIAVRRAVELILLGLPFLL